MERILFLDDSTERSEYIQQRWGRDNDLHITNSVRDAIEQIGSGYWDYVFLDHDLGAYGNGMDVVNFCAKNKVNVGLFVIHSQNVPAARKMLSKLNDYRYKAVQMPFGSW